MRAFKCDICEEFEAGAHHTITVAYITYQACTNCLEKIKEMISKIENRVSKRERK